jgi:cephalosporin-C deacetylase
MFIDLPLAQLREYRPDVAEPGDFETFWTAQLASARAAGGAPEYARVDSPLHDTDVYDVTFPGHGGDPIKAWLIAPRQSPAGHAVIVEYIGYGGGRGNPLDWLAWASTGHPYLIMDTRGQGSSWRASDTADPSDSGAPSTPGFLTRGIGDPATHYYTRLFVDAARAVDAIAVHPVARDRVIVTTGGSQGGGLSLAAAHLHSGVAATMPDVPFLAHPARAVEITDALPYGELIDYCRVHADQVEQVFRTLSYIDVVNHAKRITAPALFSVGLLDQITPASTVFAAYNHYAGDKQIEVYPYSGHEGGETRQLLAKLAFLADHGWR